MENLKKEIEKALKQTNDASKEYLKKPTQKNYSWYICCKRYYEGLTKALELIEKEA